MHMFITRGKRRIGKYLNIKAGIWKPLLNHPSKSLIKVNSLSFSKQSCIREVRKVKFLLHIKSFNGQNVFTPKFTLKKEVYWIKKVNGRIFGSRNYLVGSAVLRSVISALKLIFPTKHFPNLGKPIICQCCFQIFHGNYKFFEECIQGKGGQMTMQLNALDTQKQRRVAEKFKNSVTK